MSGKPVTKRTLGAGECAKPLVKRVEVLYKPGHSAEFDVLAGMIRTAVASLNGLTLYPGG